MQPNIIIADDHSMIRKGIKLILQSNLGYKNVGEVTTCNELMTEIAEKAMQPFITGHYFF